MSIKYGLKAYKIHPVYADNLLTLGNVYYLYKKNFDSIMYYYKMQLIDFPRTIVLLIISFIFYGLQ